MATPAPAGTPAPQGQSPTAPGKVAQTVDVGLFLVGLAFILLCGSSLAALVGSAAGAAGRAIRTANAAIQTAVGNQTGILIQLLVVPALGILYAEGLLVDWIQTQPWAPLQGEYAAVAAWHTWALKIIFGVGLFQLFLVVVGLGKHVSAFLTALVVVGANFAVAGVLCYYSVVLGEYAVSQTTFVETAFFLRGAWANLMVVITLCLINLELLGLTLKLVGKVVKVVVPVLESIVGAMAGITVSGLPGYFLSMLPAFVQKARKLIDEDAIDCVLGKVPSRIRAVLFPLLLVLMVYPCVNTFGVAVAVMLIIALFTLLTTDASEANRAHVEHSWEQRTLWGFRFGTILMGMWFVLVWQYPAQFVAALEWLHGLFILPGRAACLSQGLFDRMWGDGTWIFSLLCLALTIGVAVIAYKILSHGVKSLKELGWDLFLIFSAALGAWVVALLLSAVLIKDRWSALELQGCPVGRTKTVVATPAATPASTAKPAPGKTGATPTSSGSPAPADSSHAAYLALCKQRGIKCQ